MNYNYYCVFDFETDGTNPRTCNPLQIASLVVHPRKLEVIKGSEFSTWMKPDSFNDKDYYEKNKSTIDWHAKNWNMTPEEFLKEKIETAPPEKVAWNNFKEYLKNWYRQGKSKTVYNAPNFCGYNIYEFDLPIVQRLSKKYKDLQKDGSSKLYNKLGTIDILRLVVAWNENLTYLENYKMDHIREKFGISTSGIAHEALKDCHDEAILMTKYLKLHRNVSKNVKGWN